MFWRIYILMQKEFLAILRDRKSRGVLIVPPLLQLLIFAFAATLDVQNVTIAVLNRDAGEQSIELIERLKGAPTFKTIDFLKGIEEIEPYIDNQKGLMVMSIDEQFSRNLNANKTANVQLIFDGRKSNAAQIVNGYVSSIIDQFNKDLSKTINYELQRSEVVPGIGLIPI